MKSILLLGVLLACHLGFAGDVSSSGDEKFKSETLLNCQVIEKPVLIEMTKSLDSWSNEGFLRVTVPQATGGGKVILLEKYKKVMQIDPITNEVKMNVSAFTIGESDQIVSTLLLQLSVKPEDSQLTITEAYFSLMMKDLNMRGSSGNGQVKCTWGADKTSWD